MSLQERATLLHVKEIENLKVIQIIELKKKKKILPKKNHLPVKKIKVCPSWSLTLLCQHIFNTEPYQLLTCAGFEINGARFVGSHNLALYSVSLSSLYSVCLSLV